MEKKQRSGAKEQKKRKEIAPWSKKKGRK